MKASKFSGAPKTLFIKQGSEGTPVAELCRRPTISQATCCSLRKKCRDAGAGDAATDRTRLMDAAADRGFIIEIVRRAGKEPRFTSLAKATLRGVHLRLDIMHQMGSLQG